LGGVIGRMHRAAWAAALVAVAIGACAPSTRPRASPGESLGPIVLSTYPGSRVNVEVELRWTADGSTVVVATFLPDQPDLHLYGVELADTGIDGAGRPTRLVIVDTGWRAVGAVTSSVPSHEVAMVGFDKPFPVYPDGPVALRQVVRQVDPSDSLIDLELGFMACSSAGVCYLPVEHDRFTIKTG
jgi:hypothetical protein